MPHVPGCDGAHCRHDSGELRVYPVSDNPDHGNMILCRDCWRQENSFQSMRARTQDGPATVTLRNWHHARPYIN